MLVVTIFFFFFDESNLAQRIVQVATQVHYLYFFCDDVPTVHARSYIVALSPGPIPSFVVLLSEKLVFQCVTLQSQKLRGSGG